jgi:hypothetical protein
LVRLAAEIDDDPVTRQWLDAMGRYGEGVTWSGDELPPPPSPRPAAEKQRKQTGKKRD